MEAQGLPRDEMSCDYADPSTGEQLAVFDLTWRTGIQAELSDPVALLIDERGDVIRIASQAGVPLLYQNVGIQVVRDARGSGRQAARARV